MSAVNDIILTKRKNNTHQEHHSEQKQDDRMDKRCGWQMMSTAGKRRQQA